MCDGEGLSNFGNAPSRLLWTCVRYRRREGRFSVPIFVDQVGWHFADSVKGDLTVFDFASPESRWFKIHRRRPLLNSHLVIHVCLASLSLNIRGRCRSDRTHPDGCLRFEIR
jgi:hypothetical protein